MVGRSYNQVAYLIAILLCVGCQETLTPQARQWLQNGYTASASGEHQTVIQSMDAFLAEHARSRRADEAYYLRGLAKYHLGDRVGAQADLSAALDRSSKAEVRGKAALALGDLAWDGDDMPTAAEMYRTAVDNMDATVPPADHAAYRLGCAHQRLGHWQEADLQFSRVMELFPDEELAERSARRIHGRSWTIQVAAFNDQARAEAAVKELGGQGVRADVSPTMGKGKPIFMVLTGRYATWEQATAALPSLKKLQPDAFVTSTR
ncbi:MAG: SPOR domain-containing protein [Phycisphaerae bacterium]|nr:SPOR domain-containing protein [Phycisphaerae bacterium]